MSGTPPGWYPDAQGINRWFDGMSWTEHTQDAAPAAPPPEAPAPPSAAPTMPPSAPPAPPAPWGAPAYPSYDAQPAYQQPYGQQPYGAPAAPGSRRRTGLIAGLSALGVLLVVLGVVGTVLLVRGSDDTEKASTGATTSARPTVSAPTVSAPTVSAPTVSAPTMTSPPAPPAPTAPPAPSSEAPPESSSDPEKVADGFMSAIFASDCAAAESYVSSQLIENEGSCGGSDIPTGTFDGLTYEVGTAKVSGNTATVPVNLVVDVGDDADMGDIPGTKLTLSMTREGSRWLVSDLN